MAAAAAAAAAGGNDGSSSAASCDDSAVKLDDGDVSDESALISRLGMEADLFALVSHVYWGIWSFIQVRLGGQGFTGQGKVLSDVAALLWDAVAMIKESCSRYWLVFHLINFDFLFNQ